MLLSGDPSRCCAESDVAMLRVGGVTLDFDAANLLGWYSDRRIRGPSRDARRRRDGGPDRDLGR
jgi:hypothetical protein